MYVLMKLFRNLIDWIIVIHTKNFHLTRALLYFIIVVYVFTDQPKHRRTVGHDL